MSDLAICPICQKATRLPHCRECSGCWELRTRIEANPDLAASFLRRLGFVVKSDREIRAEILRRAISEEKSRIAGRRFSTSESVRISRDKIANYERELAEIGGGR